MCLHFYPTQCNYCFSFCLRGTWGLRVEMLHILAHNFAKLYCSAHYLVFSLLNLKDDTDCDALQTKENFDVALQFFKRIVSHHIT